MGHLAKSITFLLLCLFFFLGGVVVKSAFSPVYSHGAPTCEEDTCALFEWGDGQKEAACVAANQRSNCDSTGNGCTLTGCGPE